MTEKDLTEKYESMPLMELFDDCTVKCYNAGAEPIKNIEIELLDEAIAIKEVFKQRIQERNVLIDSFDSLQGCYVWEIINDLKKLKI